MSQFQNIHEPMLNQQNLGTNFKQGGDFRTNELNSGFQSQLPTGQTNLIKETGFRSNQPTTGFIGEHPPQHLHKHNDFISDKDTRATNFGDHQHHNLAPTFGSASQGTTGLGFDKQRQEFRSNELHSDFNALPNQHMHHGGVPHSHTHQPDILPHGQTILPTAGLTNTTSNFPATTGHLFQDQEFKNKESAWNKDMLKDSKFNRDFENINLKEKKVKTTHQPEVVGFVKGVEKEELFIDGKKVAGHTEIINEPIIEKQTLGNKIKNAYDNTMEKSGNMLQGAVAGTKNALQNAKVKLTPSKKNKTQFSSHPVGFSQQPGGIESITEIEKTTTTFVNQPQIIHSHNEFANQEFGSMQPTLGDKMKAAMAVTVEKTKDLIHQTKHAIDVGRENYPVYREKMHDAKVNMLIAKDKISNAIGHAAGKVAVTCTNNNTVEDREMYLSRNQFERPLPHNQFEQEFVEIQIPVTEMPLQGATIIEQPIIAGQMLGGLGQELQGSTVSQQQMVGADGVTRIIRTEVQTIQEFGKLE